MGAPLPGVGGAALRDFPKQGPTDVLWGRPKMHYTSGLRENADLGGVGVKFPSTIRALGQASGALFRLRLADDDRDVVGAPAVQRILQQLLADLL